MPRTTGRSPAKNDRVFVLMCNGSALARLRSSGFNETFWESFDVEPMAEGHAYDKLMDAEAWNRCEFLLQHERTGIVLDSVFSAGGRPPKCSVGSQSMQISLRGTCMFSPPPAQAPFFHWLITGVRSLLGRTR